MSYGVTRPQWVNTIQYATALHMAQKKCTLHDVIMSAMVSQITGVSIVYSTVVLGADQRKHQSSASLAFVWGIHRWPVNSPNRRSLTRKIFPFDDVIMRNIPQTLSSQNTPIPRPAGWAMECPRPAGWAMECLSWDFAEKPLCYNGTVSCCSLVHFTALYKIWSVIIKGLIIILTSSAIIN